MPERLSRVMVGAAALLAVAGAVLVPSSAGAATQSSIQFVDAASATVAFGEDWSFSALIATEYDGEVTRIPDPTAGTVSVLVSGIGGQFATGLPIQPDGRVYITQPLETPLLPAGEYELTAIFVPAQGTFYETSQTATPAKLTVTALEAVPRVEVVNDAAVSKFPVITAEIAGSYRDSRGGAPAGTWAFEAKDTSGETVFETEVGQEEGENEPLRIEIDTKLARGERFTVTSSFTTVDEYTGGVTVAPIPNTTFETPGTTFLDSLASRVAFPGWLVIGVGVFLVALVSTVIVLGVKLSRRPDRPARPTAPTIPGDPTNVQLITLEAAGIPELLPDPPAHSWSLSEDNPTELLPSSAAEAADVAENPDDPGEPAPSAR